MEKTQIFYFEGFDIKVEFNHQLDGKDEYIFYLLENNTQKIASINITVFHSDKNQKMNSDLGILSKAVDDCDGTLKDFWEKYVKNSKEAEYKVVYQLLPYVISEFRNL